MKYSVVLMDEKYLEKYYYSKNIIFFSTPNISIVLNAVREKSQRVVLEVSRSTFLPFNYSLYDQSSGFTEEN